MRALHSVAAVVLLAVASVTPVGEGAPLGSSVNPNPWVTSDQDEWPDDVLVLAEEWGVEPARAVEIAAWENALGTASLKFEDMYPQLYAGIEILSPTEQHASVSWVGSAPAEFADVLAESARSAGIEPSDLAKIDVASAPFSLAAIDQGMVSVHYAIQELAPKGTFVSTRFDRTNASYLVLAALNPGSGDSYLREAQAALRATSDEYTPTAVSIAFVPDVRAVEDARNGGGYLVIDDYLCTGGFNVISSTGVTGIATAGHCSNTPGTHRNRPGNTSFNLTYKAGHQGQWGDFQWHTTGDTESDDFYYAESGGARDVSGQGSPVDGQTLCRFGYTTGNECDTVTDLSVCSGSYCRLVEMAHREASPGDSGGPWYLGSVAYGYHHGGKPCGTFSQNMCDVWSRASYIDNALNVFVKSL